MVMICPKCASQLNEDAYCENCKSTFSIYNRLANTSKQLYNQGLQMAKVRNISGAIDVLQRSLKIDKSNIDARNLLGLLYFEIGETVSALQEWVISKNMKPEDNLAMRYIKTIQDNQFHLDKLNSAIKKYNIALQYIKQGNEDMAIIQLKKVISTNPKFIKAYSLLALCYIKDKEHHKAEKILKSALVIDKSNYIANKYYNELKSVDAVSDDVKEEEDYSYNNGIKPIRTRGIETNSVQQVLLAVGGIVIGLAVAMFLITPNMISKKDSTISALEEELNTVTTNLATTTSELEKANSSIKSLTSENETLSSQKSETESILNEGEKVLLASNYYMAEENEQAADEIYFVDPTKITGTEYEGVYIALKGILYPMVSEDYYLEGYNLYNNYSNYEDAIEQFTLALKFAEDDYMDSYYAEYALYRRARSYYKIDDEAKALEDFKRYAELYPEGYYIRYTNNYIAEIEG